MPTITISKQVVEKYLGKKLPLDELKDRIAMLGTDLESIKDDEITVEIFPNRPDMLSEQGFARALASFIGTKKGLKTWKVTKTDKQVRAESSLPKEWPYAFACVVKGLEFDDKRIKEVVQIQEKLHITLLRRRKKGGIGLYPLEKIQFPIRFVGMDPDEIKFRPLEYPHELSGRQILEKHATGKKYKNICEDWKKFPVFIDANNTIMSMPPIINAHDVGKIDETTTDVFVEVTGNDRAATQQALTIIVTALADMGGKVHSIENITQQNKKLLVPNLEPTTMKLNQEHVNNRLGLQLNKQEIKELLERMGYNYHHDTVSVPAYRADVLHEVDIIQDISIAYGYENFEPELPNITTTAKENHHEVFKRRIAELIIGHGFLETNSYLIASPDVQNRKMNSEKELTEIENPNSHEYSVMRAWIIPSLLHILSENKHHEYPQQLFEIGDCFHKHNTETKCAIVSCHKTVTFTEMKQIFDACCNTFGVECEIKETEHPSFIPGRVAQVSVNGKNIALVGEINPAVLDNFGIDMPVAAVELNLSELYEIIQK